MILGLCRQKRWLDLQASRTLLYTWRLMSTYSSPGVAEPAPGLARPSYEETIRALNSLQSNAAELRASRQDRTAYENSLASLASHAHALDIDLGSLPVIHIAGTKGKGSTSIMVESILRMHGLRTGLFTSPHLVDVRERIRINRAPVEESLFTRYFWEVFDTIRSRCEAQGERMPAYFRFLTLLGLHVFKHEAVDAIVLEVGVGGRLDATNIVEKPVVCGITSLGYDHQRVLGNTLIQIALEKAGIAKPGVPLFTIPQRRDALCAIWAAAQRAGAPVGLAPALDPSVFAGTSVGIAGAHQAANAELAVALAGTFLKMRASKSSVSMGKGGGFPENDPVTPPIPLAAPPAIPDDALEPIALRALAPDAMAHALSVVSDQRKRIELDRLRALCAERPDIEASLQVCERDEKQSKRVGAGTSETDSSAAAPAGAAVAAPSGTPSGNAALHAPPETRPVVTKLPEKFLAGLVKARWPARCQHVARHALCDVFVDGCHTVESTVACMRWFLGKRAAEHDAAVAVVFNCSTDRNANALLATVSAFAHSAGVRIDRAVFTPFAPFRTPVREDDPTFIAAAVDSDADSKDPLSWQRSVRDTWIQIGNDPDAAFVEANVQDALERAEVPGTRTLVLVCGSLYLAGSALQVLGQANAM